MAGLSSVVERKGKFLTVAGKYIWNRKMQDEEHSDYKKEEYTTRDGDKKERSGARYEDLSGMITGVRFRTHEQYGESINVTFQVNEEVFIISISTGNRYCTCMMKFLLKADLGKEVFMKPYDFIGKDGDRAHGISFRQDGEKIALKNEDSPKKPSEWYDTASKRDKKRQGEDVTDWFVKKVKADICSQFKDEQKAESKSKVEEQEAPKEEVEQEQTSNEQEAPKVTPLRMKKALREYIKENYEDETLPKLGKADLVKWYNLCLQEEELPFDDGDVDSSEGKVDADDLDKELDNLISK